MLCDGCGQRVFRATRNSEGPRTRAVARTEIARSAPGRCRRRRWRRGRTGGRTRPGGHVSSRGHALFGGEVLAALGPPRVAPCAPSLSLPPPAPPLVPP